MQGKSIPEIAWFSLIRCIPDQVFVNEWYAGGVETPFGGYGKSGCGREKGGEALWNYVQTRSVAIRPG